jgi:hypothetical protein
MEISEDARAEPNPLANWRTLYINCLIREALPVNKMEA